MRRLMMVAVLVLLGTGAARAQGRGVRVTEVAGVRTVENTAPAWGSRARWTVDPKPLLSLGDGIAPQEQFGQVVGAVRLRDGSMMIADEKNLELRLFSASGSFVRAIGQKGDGPGDYRSIAALFLLPGDTLLVWDPSLHRATSVTRDGAVRRTLAVQHPPEIMQPGVRGGTILELTLLGRAANGSMVGSHTTYRINPADCICSDSTYLLRVAEDGNIAPMVTLYHGASYNFHVGTFTTGDDVPFTAKSSFAVGPRSLWYTDAVHFELREYDLDGKLQQVARTRRTPAPVRPEEIAALDASEIDGLKTMRVRNESSRQALIDAQRQVQQRLVLPHTHPAYIALLLDPAGNVWARQYGDTLAAEQWDTFDKTGRWLGTVELPPRLDLYAIGADYVLGKVRDQDDLETVREYRLRR